MRNDIGRVDLALGGEKLWGNYKNNSSQRLWNIRWTGFLPRWRLDSGALPLKRLLKCIPDGQRPTSRPQIIQTTQSLLFEHARRRHLHRDRRSNAPGEGARAGQSRPDVCVDNGGLQPHTPADLRISLMAAPCRHRLD